LLLKGLNLVDQGLPLALSTLLSHILEGPIIDVDLLKNSNVLLHQRHDSYREKHDRAYALLGKPLPFRA
jgi:hypothetical protein